MASRFQAVPLVAAPSYPNAIAWSDENLIAIASGHLVTIINPAPSFRPRGIITIDNADPLPIGVIERDQLHSGCLLPICLTRDCRPCVKSISWSPLGMSSHAGCLLAVCTTEGRVKLYRPPFCDFSAEWIEITDISTKLYGYYASENFRKFEEQELEDEGTDNLSKLEVIKECKRRKTNAPSMNNKASGSSRRKASNRLYRKHDDNGSDLSDLEVQGLPTAREKNLNQIVSRIKSRENPLKKIEENLTLQRITSNQYASRMAMLSSLAVAWSPVLNFSQKVSLAPRNGSSVSILAVGGKCGKLSLWKVSAPECFNIEDSAVHSTVVLVGLFQSHASWITNITWTCLDSASSKSNFILVTGSNDGSVKIWSAYCNELLASSETSFASFSLLKELRSVDAAPVSTLALAVPARSPHTLLLTIGKGSGSFEILIWDSSNGKHDKAWSFDVHDRVVTGLAWALDGNLLFSCSEDNFIRCWILDQNSFCEVPVSSNNPDLRTSNDLPDTFRSCFGVAASPGNLIVAVVRNFDIDSLDPMYEARRVVLVDMKPVQENHEFMKAEGKCFEEKEISLWRELLVSCERELRQRLVAFSFSAFLNSCSQPSTALPGDSYPNGLAEMLKWVDLNNDYLHDSLRGLASDDGMHQKRLQSGKDITEEKCCYCSTSVPFESPEDAFCKGVLAKNGVNQRHKLERCAVSMQVCPSTPLWFCICCQRWAFRLAPEALFTMPGYPSDFEPSRLHDSEITRFPLCPFCGILMQRKQPDFLLSASPV